MKKDATDVWFVHTYIIAFYLSPSPMILVFSYIDKKARGGYIGGCPTVC